jgi:ABC-type multidrug transport system permease subunit
VQSPGQYKRLKVSNTLLDCIRTDHLCDSGPASIVMLSLVIYTGFTIPVGDMRPYLRWINFLSPLGYVFESLMVNEFDGRDFPCVSFLPAGPGYDEQPLSSRICSTTGATAGSSVVSGTNYLEATFKYTKAHLWRCDLPVRRRELHIADHMYTGIWAS